MLITYVLQRAHRSENSNQQAPWAFALEWDGCSGSLCASPDGKAAVQSKTKAVNVKHAKTESESLTGMTFNCTVPYPGATVQTIVPYLQGKM